MDIDLRWGGDPSIILAVEALVASLPIQVQSFDLCLKILCFETIIWFSFDQNLGISFFYNLDAF